MWDHQKMPVQTFSVTLHKLIMTNILKKEKCLQRKSI